MVRVGGAPTQQTLQRENASVRSTDATKRLAPASGGRPDRSNDDTLEHASGTIAMGLVIAGLLVGSSVLILAERGIEGSSILRGVGITGLVIAILLAITLPIRWIRRRK